MGHSRGGKFGEDVGSERKRNYRAKDAKDLQESKSFLGVCDLFGLAYSKAITKIDAEQLETWKYEIHIIDTYLCHSGNTFRNLFGSYYSMI